MTNTTRRIYSVALMAALSLGLSGCWFNNNDDNQPTPSTTSSPSASASPSTSASPEPSATASFSPEEIKEVTDSLDEKPLGIDIKTSLATRSSPEIEKVYPAETFNVEEGVRQVFNTYQEIVGISELQVARPEGSPPDSQYLIGFEDRLHGDFLEKAKTALDTGGHIIPTANRDGSLGTLDGVKYHATGKTMSNYGEPSFGVLPDPEYGNVLIITGLRGDRVPTKEGVDLALEYKYTITAVPSADTWLITGLGIQNTSAKVLND